MPRLFGVLLFLLASPAAAQGWETFSHDLGAGAAVCPYDDPETGEFFCFAVACLPDGGPPMIRVAFYGPDIREYRAPLSVRIDGRMVTHMFLTRLSEADPADGLYDYGTELDPERDARLLEALKTGTRATLVFGIGLKAILQQVTLSGSHAALDAVPRLCDGTPVPAGG
ncbi:hypothetical protein P1J78_08110 [Psychromarinibacter sp. C21-152]|uniref:Invasion protein IalB, involved in pathogenesis n=1 Tax=Psychromarinibacter sediminicola TaxID=3033385 RepID=A0AAE3NTM0_9RHOB|nr:hypothetical protein [Psychromarinibacter sediminicola]MDF0600690.1 hypothetical protein [Psychromarinibacter sediminicola]